MKTNQFHPAARRRWHWLRSDIASLDPQLRTEEVPRAQLPELHHKVAFLGLPSHGYRYARSATGNMANEAYRRGEEAAWGAAHVARTQAEIMFAWLIAVKLAQTFQHLEDLQVRRSLCSTP